MKQGEINYLNAIGRAGQVHAMNKPWSDAQCSSYLVAMGQILGLLPAPPARVLDLGCGTGWTTVMLARRGYRAVGFDIAPDMIDAARRLAAREGASDAEFHVGDYEDVALAGPFDAVLFFDALHHAEDERAALASVYRVLRPGGVCIASEPGRGHSRTAESRRAMEQFGVTEKDMPPSHVVPLARRIGFSASVQPHLSQVARLLGDGDISTASAGWKRRLLRQRWMRPLLACLLIVRLKRHNGIVVLGKPANAVANAVADAAPSGTVRS